MTRKQEKWYWSEGSYGTRVFDGKPCVRCQSVVRLLSTRRCRDCNQRYMRQHVNTRTDREAMRGKPCEICTEAMEQPCFDEVDGKLRGWLCHHCNLGLGQFRENATLLRKAFQYVMRTRG